MWTDISLLSKLAVALAVAYDPTNPSAENVQFRWMNIFIMVTDQSNKKTHIKNKNKIIIIKQDKILQLAVGLSMDNQSVPNITGSINNKLRFIQGDWIILIWWQQLHIQKIWIFQGFVFVFYQVWSYEAGPWV